MNLDLRLPLDAAEEALPATLLLNAHKQEEFSNAVLGLRHPAAIYKLSLFSITQAFNTVLETLSKDLSAVEDKKLIADTDALLDAVMEHFDDLENIIKIFFHESGERQCGKELRRWNDTVCECRSFVANQVNKIKHEQGRLRLVHIVGREAEMTRGYFVEGVLEDGAIGPHPDVHPGSNSAYSYVRVLRYLLCTALFASRALCAAVDEKVRIKKDIERHGLGELLPVLREVVALGENVFFDEGTGVTPFLRIRFSSITIRAGRMCAQDCRRPIVEESNPRSVAMVSRPNSNSPISEGIALDHAADARKSGKSGSGLSS